MAFILIGTMAMAAAAQTPSLDASVTLSRDACVMQVGGDPTARGALATESAVPAASPALVTSPAPVAVEPVGTMPSTTPGPLAAALSIDPLDCPQVAPTTGTAAADESIVASSVMTARRAVATSTNRTPGTIRHRYNVPFMKRQACAEFRSGCINRADIYYPSKAGPWPVIVTIHGRPRRPSDMAELAESLAARGAVVFNVDYRGVRPVSKGFPESMSDVACAIRYARQNAKRYGGDRGHVVLVGHSMGGYVGAMVALAGDTFPSAPGTCKSTLGMKSSLPNGFVSVAGVSAIHHDYHIDQVFLGGTYQQIPKVWKRATLYTHIGRHIGHNHRLHVGIIFERHDPYMGIGHATHLHAALKQAGYDSDLILLNHGTTHFDILDMDLRIGQRVLTLVWHIVRETDRD